jgi:tetratricopeptide (TPR) repeat protein
VSTKTLFFVLGGLIFGTGLYFLPDRTPPQITLYDDLIEAEIEVMPANEQAMFDALNNRVGKGNKEAQRKTYAELASFWQARNQSAIQAEFLRKAAGLGVDAPEEWGKSGDLFFESIHSTEDESEQMDYVFHAMYCYEKLLEANPDDLNRKLNLSECYTEHQGNIMQGVLLLREVATADPSNAEAQMRLGRFSLMSGQNDKAIARFKSALAGDSLNLQARVLLAESLASSGDLNGAIQNLKEGLALFSDTLVINELQNIVSQLETASGR